jgi:hypothetical protein
MKIKIPVTVQAVVFIDEDDMENALQNEKTLKYEEIIQSLVSDEVPDQIEGYEFKVRDIYVDTSSLSKLPC